MTKLTKVQKENHRNALFKAINEGCRFRTDHRWFGWVLVVSSIRMRCLRLGGRSEKSGYVLTDFVTDGRVTRSQNGVPYSVEGGTFLVFCKFNDHRASSSWLLRINITPEADPRAVVAALEQHNYF
ncbi:MAG: hypothetical protein WA058_00665 [Minisyncoccia bacterium]